MVLCKSRICRYSIAFVLIAFSLSLFADEEREKTEISFQSETQRARSFLEGTDFELAQALPLGRGYIGSVFKVVHRKTRVPLLQGLHYLRF